MVRIIFKLWSKSIGITLFMVGLIGAIATGILVLSDLQLHEIKDLTDTLIIEFTCIISGIILIIISTLCGRKK